MKFKTSDDQSLNIIFTKNGCEILAGSETIKLLVEQGLWQRSSLTFSLLLKNLPKQPFTMAKQ